MRFVQHVAICTLASQLLNPKPSTLNPLNKLQNPTLDIAQDVHRRVAWTVVLPQTWLNLGALWSFEAHGPYPAPQTLNPKPCTPNPKPDPTVADSVFRAYELRAPRPDSARWYYS